MIAGFKHKDPLIIKHPASIGIFYILPASTKTFLLAGIVVCLYPHHTSGLECYDCAYNYTQYPFPNPITPLDESCQNPILGNAPKQTCAPGVTSCGSFFLSPTITIPNQATTLSFKVMIRKCVPPHIPLPPQGTPSSTSSGPHCHEVHDHECIETVVNPGMVVPDPNFLWNSLLNFLIVDPKDVCVANDTAVITPNRRFKILAEACLCNAKDNCNSEWEGPANDSSCAALDSFVLLILITIIITVILGLGVLVS